MEWLVLNTLEDEDRDRSTYEAETHEEAFVRWRRAVFPPRRLWHYKPGDVMVSVFPIKPRVYETREQIALFDLKRRDFDLCETNSLAVMAIEAHIRLEERKLKRRKRNYSSNYRSQHK